ncbi:MAG TPA: hypothetical protein VI389_07950 [Geobacteraceae bacterium]
MKRVTAVVTATLTGVMFAGIAVAAEPVREYSPVSDVLKQEQAVKEKALKKEER